MAGGIIRFIDKGVITATTPLTDKVTILGKLLRDPPTF